MPTASHAFAEISYTLTDLIVAAYNKVANTYSTPAGLAGGQMATVEPQADNDQLREWGAVGALLSVVTSAKLTIGMGGIDYSAMNIICGITDTISGVTPNQVRTSRYIAGGAGLPYFGTLGTSPTDDGGIAVVGLQCCKLDTYPNYELDGKTNKFSISEIGGMAIPVTAASVYQLMKVKTFETPGDYTAPTTGAEFLAFFA